MTRIFNALVLFLTILSNVIEPNRVAISLVLNVSVCRSEPWGPTTSTNCTSLGFGANRLLLPLGTSLNDKRWSWASKVGETSPTMKLEVLKIKTTTKIINVDVKES